MRRRGYIHANSLQDLPIADLSVFKGLQIARGFWPRINFEAERVGGAREHKRYENRCSTKAGLRQQFSRPVADGQQTRRRTGAARAPARRSRRLRRAPDRRSGPKNREIGFAEQGIVGEEQGAFCVRTGELSRPSRAPRRSIESNALAQQCGCRQARFRQGPALNCAGISPFAPRPAPGPQRTAATRPWRPGRPAADPAGSPTAPCAGGSPCS